jgi:hypothetical protein
MTSLTAQLGSGFSVFPLGKAEAHSDLWRGEHCSPLSHGRREDRCTVPPVFLLRYSIRDYRHTAYYSSGSLSLSAVCARTPINHARQPVSSEMPSVAPAVRHACLGWELDFGRWELTLAFVIKYLASQHLKSHKISSQPALSSFPIRACSF